MDAHEPATTERLRVRARAFYDGISGRAQLAGGRPQRLDGESPERGKGLEDRPGNKLDCVAPWIADPPPGNSTTMHN